MIRNLIELARELINAARVALTPQAVETCPAWCPCRVELDPNTVTA